MAAGKGVPMLRPARGLRVYAVAAALVILPSSGAAQPERTRPGTNIDPRLGTVFPLAVTQAAARLQSPACAALLEEFRDHAGELRLSERLAETGQSASAYVSRWITFTSGLGLGPCQHSEIAAFTSPGSRVVFICRDQFLAAWRGSEANAANLLIHEVLHSLGLGENPPDSKVITAQVQARCGR